MKKIKKLFTLIELIVVIVVMGILAAIVVPNISSWQGEANESAIVSNMRNLQTSVDMYVLENHNQLPVKEITPFEPQPLIDFEKLHPEYTRNLPDLKNAKYWIDSWGIVWGSTVDAPKVTNNTGLNVTWEKSEGAETYNVYKVEGYKVTSNVREKNLQLKLIEETSDTKATANLLVENGFYVVSAVDSKGFETAPVGSGYKGYDYFVALGQNQPPVAELILTPNENIDSGTKLLWDYKKDTDPNGDEIVTAEWELDGEKVSIPTEYLSAGQHIVKLRVKDFMNNWSEWKEYTIEVSEKPIKAGSNPDDTSLNPNLTCSELEGSGTIADPYQIANANGLNAVRNCLSSHFILVNDINLINYTNWAPIGTTYSAPFNGTFDGKNYAISNLKFTRSTNYNGLFGYSKSPLIQNVVLKNVNISGGNYTGALVGNSNGEIKNAHMQGTVVGTGEVGGLVGANYSTVSKSSANATVKGGQHDTGGLVGINNMGSIFESFTKGSVQGTYNVGGVVGYQIGTTRTKDVYSNSNVKGMQYVGGIAGWSGIAGVGKIDNAYATGLIEGDNYVGGISGRINNAYGELSEVNNSFALNSTLRRTSGASGTAFHRIVGTKQGGILNGVYANSAMQFQNVSPSMITGTTGEDGYSISLTSARSKSTYTSRGWDFNNIWTISEGSSYPKLKWENN